MRTRACFWTACAAMAAALWQGASAAPPAEPAPTSARSLDRGVRESFDRGEYGRAEGLLRRRLEGSPRDPFVVYNLACALSMQGRTDEAAEALLDALSYGFTDLHHMDRDPHLAGVRGHASYRRVVGAWREVLDARGAAELEGAREFFGPSYLYSTHDGLRVHLACALPEGACLDAVREMERVARWAEREAGIAGSPDPARPDPWVLVVVPTARDLARLIGRAGVGGYYDRDRKRLVTQDIGPSLRHEFFHVVHWRDMDRRGQRHPHWVMEGLACLLEDVDEGAGGEFRLAPSWRTNIARRLALANRLTAWERLFALDGEGYMGSRARAHYAQSRAVFMFLHERGVLREWYGAFVEGFDGDGTGMGAVAAALGSPAREAEASWRGWLRELPAVAEIGRPGGAWLGVEVAPGAGDGPVVDGTVSMSAVRHEGPERLRRRDVITAVDGRTTRTLDDLHRVLGDYEPGDGVVLSVRRGSRELTVRVILVPPSTPPPFP